MTEKEQLEQLVSKTETTNPWYAARAYKILGNDRRAVLLARIAFRKDMFQGSSMSRDAYDEDNKKIIAKYYERAIKFVEEFKLLEFDQAIEEKVTDWGLTAFDVEMRRDSSAGADHYKEGYEWAIKLCKAFELMDRNEKTYDIALSTFRNLLENAIITSNKGRFNENKEREANIEMAFRMDEEFGLYQRNPEAVKETVAAVCNKAMKEPDYELAIQLSEKYQIEGTDKIIQLYEKVKPILLGE